MTRSLLLLLAALVATSTVMGDAQQSAPKDAKASAPKRLKAFQSEAELQEYLRVLGEEQQKRNQRFRVGANAAQSVPAPAAAAAPDAAGAAAGAESITNVQHAGVDEGGIVKLRRDHLVVLRRGRLFTIDIGQNHLTPISAADAFGPEIDPRGTWYDELLVSNDKVVVIGYSYARGGTEIGLFDLDGSGNLHYRSTYHLRSNDYYSSRNYSSRLIGSRLIFYSPSYVSRFENVPLPALRKWHAGATESEFRRIAEAPRIYRPVQPLQSGVVIHTVTSCDLARVEFDCTATSFIGPSGRVFYVSPSNVYVWTTDWTRSGSTTAQSVLYAMPLDGSAPGAVQVYGAPTDQFSFLESPDSHLNVLVRSNANGDGMWSAERSRGGVALLRLPLSFISDGTVPTPTSFYRALPAPEGYAFQNRFIGNFVFYGLGSGWGRPANVDNVRLYGINWKGGDPFELSVPHAIDRLEPMGAHGTVIGTDGRNLHFTTLRLDREVSIAGRYTRPDASQGELRSHGFFYRANDASTGLLGLPIRRAGRPGFQHLFRDSAAIVFLRNDALRLSPIGELDSQPDKAKDDACRASCVDWYGNARPLFIAGRVFALLGYEMVEGAMREGRLQETRRVSFAPSAAAR